MHGQHRPTQSPTWLEDYQSRFDSCTRLNMVDSVFRGQTPTYFQNVEPDLDRAKFYIVRDVVSTTNYVGSFLKERFAIDIDSVSYEETSRQWHLILPCR